MSQEWTLDQTLGWVLWRDIAIAEGLRRGHFGAEVMYNHNPRHAEQDDLLEILRAGDLKCRGSRFGTEDKEEMPPAAWKDLKIVPHLTRSCKAVPKAEGKTFWTGIIFSTADVKGVFSANGSMKKKKTRGRKKGTGLIPGDDKRIANMEKLLDAGEAKSPHDAAKRVVETLNGSDSKHAQPESHIRRLIGKYNAKYGT